ncbi:MAG: carotenoid biosynthesis protein [Bacteroidetes bacterium]|nr:carotenoid biosynthesis protein [Bacteroidota bacterium]
MEKNKEMATGSEGNKKGIKTISRFRWSLIVLFFFVTVLMTFTYYIDIPALISIESLLITAFLFVLVLLHGIIRYGKKNMLIFFLIVFAVSFSFENLSIRTGFPFGFYHYSPSLGLMTVPVVIIFAYFAMGYLSWMLAHIITGQYTRRLGGKQIFMVPFIAAFIMVMWDLTMDPISSTLQKLWVWHNPGAYFGVPVVNFFGWFFVVFVFYQLFAIYLSKYDTMRPGEDNAVHNKAFWMETPVVYGIMALGNILSIFYQCNDTTLSMALVTVFTMIFVTIVSSQMILNKPFPVSS